MGPLVVRYDQNDIKGGGGGGGNFFRAIANNNASKASETTKIRPLLILFARWPAGTPRLVD